MVFSPLSPNELHKLTKGKRHRLSQVPDGNPLVRLPRRAIIYEISALNSGFLFDLEFPVVWKALTNQDVKQAERMWMYVL